MDDDGKCPACGKDFYSTRYDYCSYACYLQAHKPRWEKLRTQALLNISPLETKLAMALKEWGFNHVPQHIFGPFRVDEWLPDLATVVEMDGKKYHSGSWLVRDVKRDEYLVFEAELLIVRITASFFQRYNYTLRLILDWLNKQFDNGGVGFDRIIVGRKTTMLEDTVGQSMKTVSIANPYFSPWSIDSALGWFNKQLDSP